MNIDREIAERVFGYVKEGPAPKHWKCGAEFSYTNPEGIKGHCLRCGLKPYSSDIKYAMEVEAEMFRRRWRYRSGHNAGGYWCEFYNPGFLGGRMYADNPAQAMGEAALEALK